PSVRGNCGTPGGGPPAANRRDLFEGIVEGNVRVRRPPGPRQILRPRSLGRCSRELWKPPRRAPVPRAVRLCSRELWKATRRTRLPHAVRLCSRELLVLVADPNGHVFAPNCHALGPTGHGAAVPTRHFVAPNRQGLRWSGREDSTA